MQVQSNAEKLSVLLMQNAGYITRRQIDECGIPSWFLTDFVRKNGLVKIDKGFYARDSWIRDDFFVFQYKYPRFVFSYLSALYLHQLTDALPEYFEVTAPKNYRPMALKNPSVIIHTDTREQTYSLGVTEVRTNCGNLVRVYDKEKTLCDLIRRSEKVDSEIYTKALHLYAKSADKNLTNLVRYAQKMNLEKKLTDIMTVVLNEN